MFLVVPGFVIHTLKLRESGRLGVGMHTLRQVRVPLWRGPDPPHRPRPPVSILPFPFTSHLAPLISSEKGSFLLTVLL